MNITEILNLAMETVQTGSEVQNGREKAEKLPLDQPATIDAFDFLTGDSGEYIVFTVKEDDKHFYYGNSVLTDGIKKIQGKLSTEQMDELLAFGIPVMYTGKRQSKQNKSRYFDTYKLF